MRPSLLVAMLFLFAGCNQPVVQYTTTEEVRAALAPAEIGCKDFVWEPPPTAVACSFTKWIPQRGFKGGSVVMFANPEDAAAIVELCGKEPLYEGQLLYRDGQSWFASIRAFAPDRITASNIDDQAFVTRVAELLRTDVIDC